MRGYYGIGVENLKSATNLGTLFRSAYTFGANFMFCTGKRYRHQASDTTKAWRHVPLYQYDDIEELMKNMPYQCKLVGVEVADNSLDIITFKHPERCIYLLGAEDTGLSDNAINACDHIVEIKNLSQCLNVAVAGSIMMYERWKQKMEVERMSLVPAITETTFVKVEME